MARVKPKHRIGDGVTIDDGYIVGRSNYHLMRQIKNADVLIAKVFGRRLSIFV
jgi:hypothetical protein